MARETTTATVPCPVLKIAASDDILTLTSGTQTLVFDITSGKQLPSSSSSSLPSTITDKKHTANAAQVKAKSCKLVATGYAPLVVASSSVKEGGNQETTDVQPVVASVTEDKVLRLVQADTGAVFYERTLIKKASYLTIEQDGTVIVSDKNGDVFAYPFVDDASPTTTTQPTKPRPDPVALAGDPSLNPDATLLVGHVSIVTAHAYTRDKRYLVTVDRDEHVRLNRWPETHVIDKFVWGHKDFVNTITPSEIDTDIIHTAGGDGYILTSRLSTASTVSRLPISKVVKRNQTVRAPLRKMKKRVNGQRQAGVTQQHSTTGAAGEGKGKGVQSLPVRGLPEDVWSQTPDGWGLPEGEGICVGKVQHVGGEDGNLVFFSEGTSAIHSVPAKALLSQETATPDAIKSLETPYPVLDFCHFHAAVETSGTGASPQLLLLALDPGWRYRVDGGGAWFPPKTTVVARRAGKKKAKVEGEKGKEDKVELTAEGQSVQNADKGEQVTGEEVKAEAEAEAEEEAEWTAEQVEEMSRDVFMVLQVADDGSFTDVTSTHREFVQGVQNALQRADPNVATQLPAYGNLAFLPKWASPEGDDDADPLSYTPESIEQLQAKAASQKKGANAKRQIGRLKAQGIAVEVPRTEEQKGKRADANRERKKRKMEQKMGAGAVDKAGEGKGVAVIQPESVEHAVQSMDVDTPAADV